MTRTLTLRHVDDETGIREVVPSLELDAGMAATSADPGGTALGLLEDGLRPDAILLDMMMMPLLDGPGTRLRLRKIRGLQATPAIFMTARARSREQSGWLAFGTEGVIVKPVDPMDLACQVREQSAMTNP